MPKGNQYQTKSPLESTDFLEGHDLNGNKRKFAPDDITSYIENSSVFLAGTSYKGEAQPDTEPATTGSARVLYTAYVAGTYTNFEDVGGLPIVVYEGEAIFLYWNGSYWAKHYIYKNIDGSYTGDTDQSKYQGVVTTATDPTESGLDIEDTGNWVITDEIGTFTNFIDVFGDPIELTDGKTYLFTYTSSDYWVKQQLPITLVDTSLFLGIIKPTDPAPVSPSTGAWGIAQGAGVYSDYDGNIITNGVETYLIFDGSNWVKYEFQYTEPDLIGIASPSTTPKSNPKWGQYYLVGSDGDYINFFGVTRNLYSNNNLDRIYWNGNSWVARSVPLEVDNKIRPRLQSTASARAVQIEDNMESGREMVLSQDWDLTGQDIDFSSAADMTLNIEGKVIGATITGNNTFIPKKTFQIFDNCTFSGTFRSDSDGKIYTNLQGLSAAQIKSQIEAFSSGGNKHLVISDNVDGGGLTWTLPTGTIIDVSRSGLLSNVILDGDYIIAEKQYHIFDYSSVTFSGTYKTDTGIANPEMFGATEGSDASLFIYKATSNFPKVTFYNNYANTATVQLTQACELDGNGHSITEVGKFNIIKIDSSNVTIKNLIIIGVQASWHTYLDYGSGTGIICFNNGSHDNDNITIDNCTISGKRDAITFYAWGYNRYRFTNITIKNNTIYDAGYGLYLGTGNNQFKSWAIKGLNVFNNNISVTKKNLADVTYIRPINTVNCTGASISKKNYLVGGGMSIENLIRSITASSSWTPDTSYALNDLVYDPSDIKKSYRCIVAHTDVGGSIPITDTNYWEFIESDYSMAVIGNILNKTISLGSVISENIIDGDLVSDDTDEWQVHEAIESNRFTVITNNKIQNLPYGVCGVYAKEGDTITGNLFRYINKSPEYGAIRYDPLFISDGRPYNITISNNSFYYVITPISNVNTSVPSVFARNIIFTNNVIVNMEGQMILRYTDGINFEGNVFENWIVNAATSPQELFRLTGSKNIRFEKNTFRSGVQNDPTTTHTFRDLPFFRAIDLPTDDKFIFVEKNTFIDWVNTPSNINIKYARVSKNNIIDGAEDLDYYLGGVVQKEGNDQILASYTLDLSLNRYFKKTIGASTTFTFDISGFVVGARIPFTIWAEANAGVGSIAGYAIAGTTGAKIPVSYASNFDNTKFTVIEGAITVTDNTSGSEDGDIVIYETSA